MNPEPWSPAENQAFIEMAQEGRCAAEIAELLERPITGVYWKAQYFSIPLKRASGDRLKGNALSDKDVEQIRSLRNIGWKPKQIQQGPPKPRTESGDGRHLAIGAVQAVPA